MHSTVFASYFVQYWVIFAPIYLGGFMPVSSPADDTAVSKGIECGAAISSKVKFCLQCGASQTKATPSRDLGDRDEYNDPSF